MLLTPEFHIVNRFLGWGSPFTDSDKNRRGIWFVGIEEGSAWKEGEHERIHEEYDCVYAPVTHGEEDSFQWSRMAQRVSKIVAPLSRSGKELGWEEYGKTRLWTEGSGVLHINLYPIGKPHLKSWHDHFTTLFGVEKAEINSYRRYVQETRFKKIYEKWVGEWKPTATICFGKTAWAEFIDVFRLFDELHEDKCTGKIKVYPNKRVILLPHITGYWHFQKEHQDEVVRQLIDWGITIP